MRLSSGRATRFAILTVVVGMLSALSIPSRAQTANAQGTPIRIEAANTIAPSETIVVADDAAADSIPIASLLPTTKKPKTAKASAPTSVAPAIEPSGEWQCPVPNAKFTNDWGAPRSGGRAHEGTDMLAPRGSPVYAPVAGVVSKDNGPMSGLTFRLKSADGYTYVGMHLSAFGATGDVKAGEVVGYVGDSGNARGTNHLHFEIHPTKKSKVNPYATLRKYC